MKQEEVVVLGARVALTRRKVRLVSGVCTVGLRACSRVTCSNPGARSVKGSMRPFPTIRAPSAPNAKRPSTSDPGPVH